jgi:two-component system NtrC family sensor kinase
MQMGQEGEELAPRRSFGGKGYEEPESAAERALTERPSISIRLRIGLGIAVCFLFTAGVTIAWMISIQEVGASQQFLEHVNRYVFELEQARRFEKNFLLYATNLDDALINVEAAHRLLVDSRNGVVDLVGPETFAAIEDNLLQYNMLLERLSRIGVAQGEAATTDRVDVEHALRTTGAKALEDASALSSQERLRMHTMIHTSKVVALAGLTVVLLVLAYIAGSLARQILSPLGRFVSYTHRIAQGDYSPILPVRRFKDEFSELALAINSMLEQIKDHQAQLARSSRMAAVGTLTAGIAHELNNPLNNISITAEAILDGYDEYSKDQKMKMLNDICGQVERAGATVRNLLDFTRVDKPVFVPVAAGDVARECARLVANEARLGGVELRLDMPPDLPKITGNPRDLQQVFLNLLLNAIQAMPEGGTITVRGLRADPDLVRFDIADTGVGIPEENLGSIFDPFFTTKEVGAGTGLGLSVAFGIVQKHHGRLEVASQPGVGTTFSLYLPRSRGTNGGSSPR